MSCGRPACAVRRSLAINPETNVGADLSSASFYLHNRHLNLDKVRDAANNLYHETGRVGSASPTCHRGLTSVQDLKIVGHGR
jgi:hypothetical protein